MWPELSNIIIYEEISYHKETHALKQLQKCTHIIIQPADKGCAAVVMRREAYLLKPTSKSGTKNTTATSLFIMLEDYGGQWMHLK